MTFIEKVFVKLLNNNGDIAAICGRLAEVVGIDNNGLNRVPCTLYPAWNPGRFGPIPVRSGRFGPGRFGPISGVSRFGPGLFGPISGVSRFGPVRAGRFGPIS